jgi:uncharacterized protein YbjQ (UPF0145 family)
MIITNIEQVPGKTVIRELGLVQGSTVRGKHIGRDIGAFFKGLVGGNIKAYERLVARGRREALIRLKEEADLRGLDKLVNVRFNTSMVSGRFLQAVEMVAYGTGIRTQR